MKFILKSFVLTVLVISSACASGLPLEGQTLTAGDLAIQYKHSKAEVRNKYDGRTITVRGYVMFEAVMPRVDEYEGLINVADKDTNGASQILCWFTREEAEEFSSVKARQYVTVKGIFNGERGTELKFCKLVEK